MERWAMRTSSTTGGGGLSPALPSSVDPNGMPTRPTCNVDRDGIDEPALPAPALPVVAQALDAGSGRASAIEQGSSRLRRRPSRTGTAHARPWWKSGAGLVPGAVISVAPSGMPMGATGERRTYGKG